MTVYIDIYFISNFIIDYIILTLSCIWHKPSKKRRISGALLGAVYGCLYLFPLPDILFSMPSKLGIIYLMSIIMHYPCNAKRLFENTLSVFITSVFVCGTIYCILNFTNKTILIPQNKINSDLPIVTGICISTLIYKLCTDYFKKKSVTTEKTITIHYNSRRITTYGFLDTGNSLKDPISGYPVIIVNEVILKSLISPEITKGNLSEFVNPEDFRVIPFKTISEIGTMHGFIPEKIEYDSKEIRGVIIALAPKRLEADVLLNPLII